MDKSDKKKEEYYVVFTASKHRNWMVRMQKAPFQHVYAIKKSMGKQFWIEINPLCSHTDINIHPVSEYPTIRALVNREDKVIKVKTFIKQQDRWTFCVFNCVEVVKSLLGIKDFWIFTPKQLYLKLGGSYV